MNTNWEFFSVGEGTFQ